MGKNIHKRGSFGPVMEEGARFSALAKSTIRAHANEKALWRVLSEKCGYVTSAFASQNYHSQILAHKAEHLNK